MDKPKHYDKLDEYQQLTLAIAAMLVANRTKPPPLNMVEGEAEFWRAWEEAYARADGRKSNVVLD